MLRPLLALLGENLGGFSASYPQVLIIIFFAINSHLVEYSLRPKMSRVNTKLGVIVLSLTKSQKNTISYRKINKNQTFTLTINFHLWGKS
jgi:hypothetical protein